MITPYWAPAYKGQPYSLLGYSLIGSLIAHAAALLGT